MRKFKLEQAVVLCGIKEFDKAANILQKILKNNDKDYDALNLLGVIAAQKKDYTKSLKYLESSLKINSENYIALNNLGLIYLNLKKLDLAIINFNKALKINQNYSQVHNNIGNYYIEKKEFSKAIKSYEEAIKINSNFFEAFNNIGLAYFHLENFNEAQKNYLQAIKLNKSYYEAYNNLGTLFLSSNKNIEAIKYFSLAIQIKTDYSDAYLQRGEAYYELGNFALAINDLENAIKYNQDNDRGVLFLAKLKSGNWDKINEYVNYLKVKILKTNFSILPFCSLPLTDSLYLQKKNVKNFIGNLNIQRNISISLLKSEKIKIGYISHDFINHPISQLISNTFELHDKKKFDIYTFKLNSLSDNFTKKISNATTLIDLSSCNLNKISSIIKKFKIDIAVDLMGFTKNAKPEIFYERVSPLQINFLGYPGTAGHKNMDYIIADQFIIKKENENNFLEKIIYLPNCFQPCNKILYSSNKSFSKEKFNLPEDKFIFCCFNNSYKINPFIFNIWVKILKKVEKSILWILADNLDFEKNLLNEFKKNNINTSRIVFCRRSNFDEHLERFKHADLFLDSFPYCAHTTANECLQQGLPLIALCGESFASRVSGSLLSAINIPELITFNSKDYEKTAVRLAENMEELKNIKRKIMLNKNTLSNISVYTHNLEKAYSKIYQTYLNNEKMSNVYIN
jgi:predicted O-linked N-acetylglucosamine transferase (SPINDLY family)